MSKASSRCCGRPRPLRSGSLHHKDFARSAGYPTVIAHGMLQAALLATYATGLLGAATVHRFGVRFRSQVFYGDTLNCSGTVVAVEEGPRAAWPP